MTNSFTPGPTPNTVRAADGTILTAPGGWALLPPGDAALTRRVKEAGEHWVVQEKKGRKLFSRGVWAPAGTIERIRAQLDAERSTDGYTKRKAADARRRAEAQAEYVEDFFGAVLAFLAFHASHAELARRLARAVTDHATPVGSGTVARTKRIPVEQRAEAAVIAWMRHETTGYDGMVIPRVKGKRREVRRMLAQRSKHLLGRYRRGEGVRDDCPLLKALVVRHGATDGPGQAMKVATYNILKGGSRRVHWVKMIEGCGVDLLLVQESYPHHEHLPPVLFPDAGSRCAWEMAGRNGWGSAVFSRTGSIKPVPVPGFTGWVVGAEITGASWQAGVADPLLAFSVHAPSGAGAYWKVVNGLLDEIQKVAKGREVIIGGDFNLTVSHWPGPERPTCKQDLAIQARLADEFGLLNCWQAANPEQPLSQTLRWTNDRTIPYHCDGIFVPRSWGGRLQSCVVLAGDEWDRLSDHNPVVACFS